jgi:hypothetical protein
LAVDAANDARIAQDIEVSSPPLSSRPRVNQEGACSIGAAVGLASLEIKDHYRDGSGCTAIGEVRQG